MQQLRLFPMPFDTAQPIHYYPTFWLQAHAATQRNGSFVVHRPTLVVRRGRSLSRLLHRRCRRLSRTLAAFRGFIVTLYPPGAA